jgi:hypothetical protein
MNAIRHNKGVIAKEQGIWNIFNLHVFFPGARFAANTTPAAGKRSWYVNKVYM